MLRILPRKTLPIRSRICSIIVILLLIAAGCSRDRAPSPSLSSDKISYNAQIRPILSDKCFACHGPDANTREADLRLDNATDATAALTESPRKFAIVPGKPGRSELIARIHHHDAEERMPPEDAKLELSAHEKMLLERWIQEGAHYDPLWSFLPPEKLPPPESNGAWIQNEIDAFVQSNLSQAGLAPAPGATRETLIRRAAFDLTGLPPTLSQIDNFINDPSPDAFASVVDQFLRSPAYGERMASWWLDIARYADSDGYLDDKHRDFSPWRDWVIDAFNKNLSYQDFVTWQLAGDLLPDASQEQILATAFNRLHKKNSEAGIVFEEFRVEYVADRTNTFGKTFLGMTMECARCHDHKYDPISQKEYYALFGFFNSTNEIGHAVYGPDQTPGPALLLTSSQQERAIDSLKAEIQSIEQALHEQEARSTSAFNSWLEQEVNLSAIEREIEQEIEKSRTAHYTFDGVSKSGVNERSIAPNRVDARTPATLSDPVLIAGIQGKSLMLNDYNKVQLGEKVGWFGRTEPFSIDFWLYPDTLYQEAMVFTHSEEWRLGLRGYVLQLENNQPVFRMAHSYPQNALRVRMKDALPPRAWSHLTLTYDGSSKAEGIRIYLNGMPASTTVEIDNLYKGILFTPDIHTYGFQGIVLGQRDKFTPFKNGRIDEFSVFDRQLSALEIRYLHEPASVRALLSDDPAKSQAEPLSGEIKSLLQAHYFQILDPPANTLKKQLQHTHAALNDLLNTIPEIMVMGDLPEPRDTYVLNRGLYDAPESKVIPSTPAAILAFSEDLPKKPAWTCAMAF